MELSEGKIHKVGPTKNFAFFLQLKEECQVFLLHSAGLDHEELLPNV